MEAKRRVRELLDRLPEDCTLDDVLYQLYVVHEAERGLADVSAGRTTSHDEVVEQLRRRWLTGAAG